MPSTLFLPARKNGRRIAQDSAPGDGEFDINNLAVWATENLDRSEIGRVIAMLQDHLDKPKAEDLESPSQRRDRALAGDSRLSLPRVTASAAKGFASRYPDAVRIKREA